MISIVDFKETHLLELTRALTHTHTSAYNGHKMHTYTQAGTILTNFNYIFYFGTAVDEVGFEC